MAEATDYMEHFGTIKLVDEQKKVVLCARWTLVE